MLVLLVLQTNCSHFELLEVTLVFKVNNSTLPQGPYCQNRVSEISKQEFLSWQQSDGKLKRKQTIAM